MANRHCDSDRQEWVYPEPTPVDLLLQEALRALLPLARVALTLDGDPERHGNGRQSDIAPIWSANATCSTPFDLRMGHARAARLVLAKAGRL